MQFSYRYAYKDKSPPSEFVVDFHSPENEELWYDTVKAYRSRNDRLEPKTVPDVVDAGCIICPKCRNAKECPRLQGITSLCDIDFQAEKLMYYSQIRVREKLAKFIDACLAGVIFL